MRARSGTVAAALLAGAAALLWLSSRLTWVRAAADSDKAPAHTFALNGGEWFGALTPCALALLAAIAAVLATRGWVRRVLGGCVALLAWAVMVPPLALLAGLGAPVNRAAGLVPGHYAVHTVQAQPVAPVLAVLGAAAAFVAGVLLLRHPGRRDSPDKYQRPARVRAEAAAQDAAGQPAERVLWDALDAGTDPTVRPPDSPK